MSITQKLDDEITSTESLIEQIQSDLQRLDSLPYNQRQGLDHKIEQDLVQLDSMLNKMTNETKSMPQSERSYYDQEIREFHTQHSKMFTELRQKRQALTNDPAYRQNRQLQSNVDKGNAIIDNLDNAIAIGNDTLNTAAATQDTLLQDRQHIEHINSNLDEIEVEGKVGESRAKAMFLRAIFNKFLSWAIVVILLALLGFSLYWKFRKVYYLKVRIASASGFGGVAGVTYTCKVTNGDNSKQTSPISGPSPSWNSDFSFGSSYKTKLKFQIYNTTDFIIAETNEIDIGSAAKKTINQRQDSLVNGGTISYSFIFSEKNSETFE
ncbi:Vesicle transport v-SNARE protein [Histomonas meleagridis]|uniref:Vesicle transport v-SNARE protein n=1 Tax=Histomonas meleagridis TaxID=135588 RepID=UPI00355A777E|nr:Vesicle transport v-SNARE protein [Histomonas meleagridis]KAH0801133.1 Vesicle transport v-SNARE protein [Histomonas meleagridis]